MYANLAMDFGIGLIPVVGDFADAWFKCSTRNNVLLERFLRERGQNNPVAPAPPKQSGVRRWFGPGPHADGHHTQPHVATSAANSDHVVPSHVPARDGVPVKNGATAVNGRVAGTDGGRGILTTGERDLEAQSRNPAGEIHYRRDQ
jgi:Domain of unknown function (DUF4112)